MDNWKGVPASVWLLLVFALLVIAMGLGAMATIADKVTSEGIAALVGAVLGLVGAHIGQTAGHAQASRQNAETLRWVMTLVAPAGTERPPTAGATGP